MARAKQPSPGGEGRSRAPENRPAKSPRGAAGPSAAEAAARSDSRIRRIMAGVISAACLTTAAVGYLLWLDDPPGWAAMAFRCGVVFSSLWLAWPQIDRLPRWAAWVTVGVAIAAVFLVRRPHYLILVIVALLAALWLRPKARGTMRG